MEVMVGQFQELDEETATFARQLGVKAVQLNTPALDATGGVWAYESPNQLKRRCEGFGLKLVALENVPQAWMRDIKLGGPRQREQLERYGQTIANVGRACVPYLGFNVLVNGVWRTDTEAPGRGGALFGFDLCLGTVSEMEGGPAAVRAAIETFGPLGAICYVHFRQVQV